MGVLLAGWIVPLAVGLGAQPLSVRLDDDNLHIVAPELHFLTGKPLERLKDGASVAFLGQLSLSTDAHRTVQSRAVARFALSYDIWGERFSVTKISQVGGKAVRRSVSNLSSQAAQAWCLENLYIDLAGVPPDNQFWVRLDFRAEDPKDSTGVLGEPGINLTRLIEIFSRPARDKQPRWQLDAGPLRLVDLRRTGVPRG